MKLRHTLKKSANRSFDTSGTGYPSELYRKQENKLRFSPDKKGNAKFTKSKPRRKRLVRTQHPAY